MLKDMKTPQTGCNAIEDLTEKTLPDGPLDAETLEAIEDVNLGRNLIGPFTSVDEMMKALDA